MEALLPVVDPSTRTASASPVRKGASVVMSPSVSTVDNKLELERVAELCAVVDTGRRVVVTGARVVVVSGVRVVERVADSVTVLSLDTVLETLTQTCVLHASSR